MNRWKAKFQKKLLLQISLFMVIAVKYCQSLEKELTTKSEKALFIQDF